MNTLIILLRFIPIFAGVCILGPGGIETDHLKSGMFGMSKQKEI